MKTGEKIKIIRRFRKMTQKELGTAVGLGEKGANRIAQYEMGYRVPKKDLLDKMADVLDVNPLMLYDVSGQNAEEILQILFWLDHTSGGVHLFQTDTYHDTGVRKNAHSKKAASIPEDDLVRYHDTDLWPANPPVGLWFDYGVLNSFMKEWLLRKKELQAGEITKEEYFEWKLNWPATSDSCGKQQPKKKWRDG